MNTPEGKLLRPVDETTYTYTRDQIIFIEQWLSAGNKLPISWAFSACITEPIFKDFELVILLELIERVSRGNITSKYSFQPELPKTHT